MPKAIQPGFAARFGVYAAVFACILAVALLVTESAWTALAGFTLALSILAACVAVSWERIDHLFDDSPGAGAAVLILVVLLGTPVLLVYERTPLVPKTRWMKCNIAARRVKRSIRGTVGFHLAERVLDGRETIPTLYLILATSPQAEALRQTRDLYIEAYRAELVRLHLPRHELEHLYVGFVSKAEAGGRNGSMGFWRDGPSVN